MNFERVCYGCFREKSTPVCPYCGYDPAQYEHPALALPVGTILNGRYMTGVVLGMGGFGITYLGYDITLDIKVAIKEYLPGGMATRQADGYNISLIASRDEAHYRSGEERFLDEARILAKLQNTPNIVSVQNYFKENNTAYFVMDYIEGMSLKAFLQNQGGSIPYEQALAVLLPVMEALAQVHTQSLLHRDISPDNIYITAEGQSKLLDFGAARFAMGDNKSISVILKHGYAPEEQYRSRGNQGPWTDVYAMGATLYHCITGALPPDSIERLHDDTLKPPSALGVRIPAHAEAALCKALCVKAEDRFANMAAMIGALAGREAVRQGVASTVAMHAGSTAVPAEKPRGSRIKAFGERLRADKRLLGMTVGAGALALALLVVPIVLLTGKGREAPPEDTGGGTGTDIGMPQGSPGGGYPLQTPPPSAAPGGEVPGGTPALTPTRTVTIAPLNMTLQVPNDMLTQTVDNVTLLERTGYTTVAVGFSYFSARQMYTLQQFEENRDAIIANEMEGLNLGAWSITGGEYTMISSYPAYRVDIQLSSAQNAEFATYAITPAEGLGLYLLHVGQKLDDPNLERHRQENEAMLQSITFAGPPDMGLTMYTSLYMNIKFVYVDALLPGGMREFPEQDGLVAHIQLFAQERQDIGIFVEDASGYADSVEKAIATIDAAVEGADPGAKAGKRYTQLVGAQEYTIKEYEMEGADTGEALGVFYAVTEIDRRLYALYVWYTPEEYEQVLGQVLMVMSTLSAK